MLPALRLDAVLTPPQCFIRHFSHPARGGHHEDMVTLQLYSGPQGCTAVDGVWFLLLDICGWASIRCLPSLLPSLSVILSPPLSFPAVHLSVFLRWFPAGGWSRKVSVCTQVHQCLHWASGSHTRAGTHKPWGTPVFKNGCGCSHWCLWKLQPRCFARKLTRKLAKYSEDHDVLFPAFVQLTFSCFSLLYKIHLPSFFHSPPPALSFSCSYSY